MIIGILQKNSLQLEGRKSVFVKTRALRLRCIEPNKKGFEMALRDCPVKNELNMSNTCLITRSFSAEQSLISTMSEHTTFKSILQTLSAEKLNSTRVVDT